MVSGHTIHASLDWINQHPSPQGCRRHPRGKIQLRVERTFALFFGNKLYPSQQSDAAYITNGGQIAQGRE